MIVFSYFFTPILSSIYWERETPGSRLMDGMGVIMMGCSFCGSGIEMDVKVGISMSSCLCWRIFSFSIRIIYRDMISLIYSQDQSILYRNIYNAVVESSFVSFCLHESF